MTGAARWLLFASCAVAVAVASAQPQARRSQQDDRPTFRAATDSVSLGVSVRRQNRPVTGLRASDFEIDDNGVPQQVIDLSYEKLPIDLTVALDISGSVSGALLDELRRAVQQLRSGLRREDGLRLIAFNMRVRQIADLGDAATAVDAASRSIRAFGSSALNDSLAVALTLPAAADRRQLIMLFSDGLDTSSILDPGALMDVASRTSPTVSVVLPSANVSFGLGGASGVVVGPSAQARLTYQRLATATGGVSVTAMRGADLSARFQSVLDDFRSSYVLHFRPTGVPPGGVHTLDVRVKQSGVEVRARREYFW
jgi:VWFA-related protein